MQEKNYTKIAFLLIISFSIGILLFYLSYTYDNKYTSSGPQPSLGSLLIDNDFTSTYLIKDWELYRGKRLTPLDFTKEQPFMDEYTFIGEHRGFETPSTMIPHGSATYRLTLFLPEEEKTYGLLLPDIYSAYQLYINGELLLERGTIDPETFQGETHLDTLYFQGKDQLEILIAVSDYEAFYSGIVYPPLLGLADVVKTHISTMYISRTMVSSIALCIGIAALFTGIIITLKKGEKQTRRLFLLYSGLCFSFIIFISYPLIKSLWSTNFLFSLLELFSYLLLLFFLNLIQGNLAPSSRRGAYLLSSIGGLLSLALVLYALFFRDSLFFMQTYSLLISLYSWFTAIYLLIASLVGIHKGHKENGIMAASLMIFSAALIMDRLFPLFEPIYFGWFVEIAGAFLIVAIGSLILRKTIHQYTRLQTMKLQMKNMKQILEIQKTYHPIILEKEKEIKVANHDFHHHIRLIKELATQGEYPKLLDYLKQYEEQQTPLASCSFCNHYIIDMILRLYSEFAKKKNIPFKVSADLSEKIPVEDVDLCIILSNILENALHSAQKNTAGEIIIHIGCSRHHLILLVKNTFTGTWKKTGIGLKSIAYITSKYRGYTHFYNKEHWFYSEVYLPLKNKGDRQ